MTTIIITHLKNMLNCIEISYLKSRLSFGLIQYLCTELSIGHLSPIVDDHGLTLPPGNSHIMQNSLNIRINLNSLQRTYLNINPPIIDVLIQLISQFITNQTSILYYLLNIILPRDTSQQSTRYLTQTLLLVHVAQPISRLETVYHPVE